MQTYTLKILNNFLFRGQFLVPFLMIFITLLSHVSMAQPESDLINAVVAGDIDAVYDSLRNGANVDSRDDAGYTALILAVMQDNLDIVKAPCGSWSKFGFARYNKWCYSPYMGSGWWKFRYCRVFSEY